MFSRLKLNVKLIAVFLLVSIVPLIGTSIFAFLGRKTHLHIRQTTKWRLFRAIKPSICKPFLIIP